MSEYTKGPWIVTKTSSIGWDVKAVLGGSSESRNMVEFTLRGDVPQQIGHVLDHRNMFNVHCSPWLQFPSTEFVEMIEANANLIAAAPDMYEALAGLMAEIDECYDPTDWEWGQKAADALAKARGEG